MCGSVPHALMTNVLIAQNVKNKLLPFIEINKRPKIVANIFNAKNLHPFLGNAIMVAVRRPKKCLQKNTDFPGMFERPLILPGF